jgi:hypothetical protein
MIGKPEWFKRRKYGGWGIMPKTWQGWVYIALFLIPIFIFNLFDWSVPMRFVVLGIWALILFLDTFHIMANLNRDEREKMHEAIAERNALWMMVFVLAVGVAYEVASSAVREQKVIVDPVIVIALVLGLVVKAVTNIYLDRKD